MSERGVGVASKAPSPTLVEGWAEHELAMLVSSGLRRQLEPLASPQGVVVKLGEEELVNFSSNDYLGLASDARLVEATQVGLSAHGLGSGASRLVVGDSELHHSLERMIAAFVGTEAACLFSSGYAANVGLLSALCGPGDVIFSDALNHASIIDGCRLSRAEVAIYPHADAEALAELLRTRPGRRRVVITDAVFSMDGDLAPLPEIVAQAREHNAAVVVDEAHSTGVFGVTGAGLSDALGLEVDLRMGTLGKALGGYGAFVAGPRAVIELLVNRARTLVFSTAIPPALCAAAERAIGIAVMDGELRERLWANVRRFAAGLSALGIGALPRSPIFPVILGPPEHALAAAEFFRSHGVLVKPIRPPTVPMGTSRLRFALSAAHTRAQIDHTLGVLAAWRSGS